MEIPGKVHMCNQLPVVVQGHFQSLRLVCHPLLFLSFPVPVFLANYLHPFQAHWARLAKEVLGAEFHAGTLSSQEGGRVRSGD